ncbi:GNAT family N-acetyltransferase [Flavobacterium pallidum]|uniref:N-acetyltransferase domain-containing protein n=1 Tax=Flavobacterium pallidum TaxID=2172098 RepID=A0A2S1SIE4_9FLAO|nr:GNAT family N-acetyltransferase [Flavobacterium pallidum]AWI26184.1 hypothetical protein HYN49_09890 [Flavobacterium pallidum]
MEFTYRKAQPEDVLKLSILFKQVYIATYGIEGVSDEFANFISKQFAPERLGQLIAAHPDSLFVAVYKGNLVGVVEIEFDKKCHGQDLTGPELNKLYILERFCAKGIGEKLLELAENTAKQKGAGSMWLWVLESNARAIRFYEKHGYKKIGEASFQMETNRYENKVMLKEF